MNLWGFSGAIVRQTGSPVPKQIPKRKKRASVGSARPLLVDYAHDCGSFGSVLTAQGNDLRLGLSSVSLGHTYCLFSPAASDQTL